MNSTEKHILLANDDGIDSPGLWAAAEALSELGYVTVSAPRDHMSATGRGWQRDADGRITTKKLKIKDQNWDVYAVGGSPAQAVTHGLMELVPKVPDLVVTGINFGENFGTDVTFSGTVGAALEAAAMGFPALAISRQITVEDWDHYHEFIDFATAAYFTTYFARIMLEKKMPFDIDVLNVVVPEDATPDTPWKITRLARSSYFKHFVIREGGLDENAKIDSHIPKDDEIPPDSDMYTVRVEKKVAVVPISLDLTSRVDPQVLEKLLRE